MIDMNPKPKFELQKTKKIQKSRFRILSERQYD